MYLHLIVLFFRLSEAGLLTIGRLAESGLAKLDRSLLTALVDRWRPETHTFHLPCGEMTPTLQDVAMLLSLPISGDVVGPRVVPPTWLDDLEERFANIDIAIDVEEHPKQQALPRHGSSSSRYIPCFVTINVRVMLLTSAVMVLFYN